MLTQDHCLTKKHFPPWEQLYQFYVLYQKNEANKKLPTAKKLWIFHKSNNSQKQMKERLKKKKMKHQFNLQTCKTRCSIRNSTPFQFNFYNSIDEDTQSLIIIHNVTLIIIIADFLLSLLLYYISFSQVKQTLTYVTHAMYNSSSHKSSLQLSFCS